MQERNRATGATYFAQMKAIKQIVGNMWAYQLRQAKGVRLPSEVFDLKPTRVVLRA
jgi:phage portal protein BeeE